MKQLFIGATALLMTSAALAQSYFDFNDIPGIDGQPTVQIDLNKAMLGFIEATGRAADPAAADALSGIDNVRLRVFEHVDDVDDFLEFIDDTSGSLERDGWQRVVFVDDEESKVRIYMSFEGEVASGITVMVADGRDGAVLVNVAGLIDPEKLGQIMQRVGAGEFMNGISGGIPGATGSAFETGRPGAGE